MCWANESWSKKWGPTYGSNPKDKTLTQTLIKQKYSHKDDLNHIRWLSKAFKDPRYIRVNNKPIFIVYRPSLLPNPKKTTNTWRQIAHQLNIGEIYLCMMHAFSEDQQPPSKWGFDAAIEFQPDRNLRQTLNKSPKWSKLMNQNYQNPDKTPTEFLYSYKSAVQLSLKKTLPTYKVYRCIIPSWDNSPRRKKGATIYADSSPSLYKHWLTKLAKKTKPYSPQENFIFIHAWNEWAEGCFLEPDDKWDSQYLNATMEAIKNK